MPDPATQEQEIIRTVESLCGKWLRCSGEEERDELARQVGVCVSVFPWLWEALHPLIIDFLASTLQLRPRQQLSCMREPLPESCGSSVSPLSREPEAVRIGTVRLTADTLSAHAPSASASSPPPDCTTRLKEMPAAIDFGEEERQQVLRAYREDELRWKRWLIPEVEFSPTAPPRTCRPPSPPRSDYSSPAAFLARMWLEDEEPVAMDSQVLSTAASRRKRRSRRHRALLRPVSPSTKHPEDAVGVLDVDLEEQQHAAGAQLEEEFGREPWLAPDHDERSFQGTRLALGGPRSCQGLPPLTPPASTDRKKWHSRRRHSEPQPKEVPQLLPSEALTSISHPVPFSFEFLLGRLIHLVGVVVSSTEIHHFIYFIQKTALECRLQRYFFHLCPLPLF
ncbi:uncharacterized protein LOC113024778 [Astatotilapia calliptera]|uniref:uncharacterized protein LOC113024778 n=1 Tax=Astatotilapia calliptera TaxID=8154 RepID=UPI000E4079CA|nr:uncharacterized protein LOC113024778 [Astatotilapia calliptera]